MNRLVTTHIKRVKFAQKNFQTRPLSTSKSGSSKPPESPGTQQNRVPPPPLRREQKPDPRAVFFLFLAGTGAAVGTISATVSFESATHAPRN
jgi:hypothetical protein